MRQKRAKTYRKLMNLYSISFGFRTPYQVLVDATFCAHAAQNKIDVEKQLDAVFQGQTKPMITQCCIVELYKLGSQHQHTVDMAKRFERRKCNHREAIEGDECLRAVVGDANKHRYAIATQSQPLRESLRAIPFVPIVHINRVVMIIEPPSDATLRAKALMEHTAQSAKAPELAKIKTSTTTTTQITSTSSSTDPSTPQNKKRKSGPKGPNPLSVKKKKTKTNDPKAAAPPTSSGPSSGKPSTNKKKEHMPASAPTPHASLSISSTAPSVAGKKRKRDDVNDTAVESRQQRSNPKTRSGIVAPVMRNDAAAAGVGDGGDDGGAGANSNNIDHSSRGHRKKRRRRGNTGADEDDDN